MHILYFINWHTTYHVLVPWLMCTTIQVTMVKKLSLSKGQILLLLPLLQILIAQYHHLHNFPAHMNFWSFKVGTGDSQSSARLDITLRLEHSWWLVIFQSFMKSHYLILALVFHSWYQEFAVYSLSSQCRPTIILKCISKLRFFNRLQEFSRFWFNFSQLFHY